VSIAPQVLVIEDDEHVRRAVTTFLSLVGCEVRGAEDGEEASLFLERDPPPDLIVLDLMMPKMDGRALRAYQLGRPELSAIPVIVLTAHGDVDRDEVIFRGVRWLAKPFRADELRAAVKDALSM
jgi:CheY-like chemotaxis protein